MAGGRRLGEAFVAIEADTSMFRASTIAGVKKAIAGIDANIPVRADTKDARAQIEALKRRMTDLGTRLTKIPINADGHPADNEMRKIALKLQDLAKQTATVTMKADTSKLDAEIAREELKLRKFQQAASKLKLDANDKELLAKIANLQWRSERLNDRLGNLDPATEPTAVNAVIKTIRSIDAQVAVLSARAQKIKMKADAGAFKKEIIESTVLIEKLKAEANELKIGGNIDMGRLAQIEAETLALEAAMRGLGGSVHSLTDRLTKGRVSWFGWIGGLLQAKVALFAGLRDVSGWHLGLDSIIESLAILIPAMAVLAVGLGAFAAAAFLAQHTLERIAARMQNIQIIADATGKKIAPLTDHFDQMARVIRPEVFGLLGAALSGTGQAMQTLDKLAIGTGTILDRFAARIIVDMHNGGQGIKHFVDTGEFDLQKLGNIFVNLGHVIAQIGVIASKTHIAEHLVGGLSLASNALRVISDLPTPLLVTLALVHGIYLWSGLATTALVKMTLSPLRGLANMIAGTELAGQAVRKLPADARGLKRIGAYASDIATGFGAIPARAKDAGKFLLKLATMPWTWVAVAAAGLIILGVWLSRTKSRAQEMIQAIDNITRSATIFNVINKTAQALILTDQDWAKAQTDLNKGIKEGTFLAPAMAIRFGQLGASTGAAADAAEAMRQKHGELVGQITLEAGRLTDLSRKFGTDGLAGAMALAHLAGVKVSDLFSKNAVVFATAIQQIQDMVTGYANMGQGSGQLASDLNALTVAGSDQIKAMGQLNDAYDTFIKITTGPTTGFITFAESLVRFSEDAQKSGAQMTGFGGAIEATSKKVRTSSLQLQQDFQDTLNAAEQMADAMRLTGTASDVQIKAIKNVVQVLIPMAGSNKAAAAEISALAQEAGGPATGGLKALAKWAGKTKDPLGATQKAAENATVAFANLSVDAQKLGTVLAQDLTKDMAVAVEASVGLQGAMNTFAKDIADSGTSIATTEKDRKALVDTLNAIGIHGAAADAIIQAIVGRLGSAKGPVNEAALAFENFATNGLHLSTAKADALWKKLNESNLPEMAKRADTVKLKFISLAMDGLHLTWDQADKLWLMLRKQYLDTLAIKAGTTREHFEKLAMDGLNLTRDQADKLWDKLRHQYLDTVANKAGETRKAFEKTAAQLGITRDQADKLWKSLHKVADGSPYNVKIHEDGTGIFTITGPGIKKSQGVGGSGNAAGGLAAGGFISGGIPNRDSVNAWLMPGEVVVPSKMVSAGAVDHLRGALPGFAAGGIVRASAKGGGAVGSLAGQTEDFHNSFRNIMTNAMKTAMTTALIAAREAAMAAAMGTGTGANIADYARSWVGKIPYQFGGTSLKGMDCSGFTGMVYRHFGYNNIPRTSEAQGSWVQNTPKPQPGGLAFYHSPAGGLDPGHVAVIDKGAGTVISQGGGLGPKIQRLHYMPLLWTGVPPGGFPQPAALGSKAAGSAQSWMHSHLGDYGWGLNQWGSLDALWQGESGWRWNANNPASGAYGIPQALPASKMASAGADWRTNPVTQMRWGAGYIKSVYGTPSSAYSKWLARSPHWYGEGGEIPGMAAGGPITKAERAGQTWLNAWRSRRGGGFGAAWGPKVVNEQIPEMQQAINRATILSKAGGLSAGKHRFWANAVADEKKRLVVLKRELSTERTWRGQLSGLDARLAKQVSAAGNLKSLAPNVRKWKGQIKANEYTVGQISKMLGYSDAFIKAHPAAPKLPGVVHTFGGDVGDRIGAFLAGVMAPFRNGGMVKSFDRGGWLQPGLTMAYNGTGRNERVGGGGDMTVTFDVSPSGNDFDQFLIAWLKKNVKIKGGGNVQTAWGSH